jgi:hypothetical protein
VDLLEVEERCGTGGQEDVLESTTVDYCLQLVQLTQGSLKPWKAHLMDSQISFNGPNMLVRRLGVAIVLQVSPTMAIWWGFS